jgi:hypothetical protein
LSGPVGWGLHAVRGWAETLERPLIVLWTERIDLQAESLVVPWVDRLTAGRDLADAAVAWLAQRLDQPAGSLGRSLRAMPAYDVQRRLDLAVPLVSETGVELVVRRLAELVAEGRRGLGPGLAQELNALLEVRGRPWVRVFKAIGALIPQECLPVLVVAWAGPDGTRLERPARLLADLAMAQPCATVALIVDPGTFDDYLTQAPDSRSKVLLRECRIDAPGGWGRARPEPKVPENAHRELEADEDRSLLPAHEDDEARSAAERFVFSLLESLPETAGLFQLNATLDFPFGAGRMIEVDLAARSLNLVIEIDGYHHFQDPEAFRRDRRKDLELQKRGYLVLRVLADDVVERLEEVLDTMIEAVAFCRHRLKSERGGRT